MKYAQMCGLAALCYYFSCVSWKHRRYQKEHSASYVVGCWRLLAAVYSFRMPFQNNRVNEKDSCEVYVQKKRVSKPSVENKPDKGKWPGVLDQ